MENTYDVVIIGGGPGGYVAAIRASQLGLKVALVEAKHLGGVCLNWGCIPTKALLKAAEMNTMLAHAENFGFDVGKTTFDIKKIVARSRAVSDQLAKGVVHLMKKNKITVIEGYGRFAGPGKISVELDKGKTETLTAKHIILATGAHPRSLPHIPFDGKVVWSSTEAMTPEVLPKSLLVIGSGAIGIEFASFYRQLGVDVTVVELQDRILPVEDHEISLFAQKHFEGQGIKIHTNASVESVKVEGNNAHAILKLKDKRENIVVDRVIVAVGIVPNTSDLGLDNTKVQFEKGHILTNEWMETGEPGVYAIGDITGGPWLAHKASHEGTICLEKIVGVEGVHPLKRTNIPGCTYSWPQVASVGLTEKAAKDMGHDLKIGRFPFMGNGKAIAMGETDGMLKTIFDVKTGELLGAHIVGAEATEMIQGFCIAKTLETTEHELMQTVFPHPTLSEMMHESVLDAHDRAIHI